VSLAVLVDSSTSMRSGNKPRGIDNPLKAFERISKETGAEAFFRSDQRDLEKTLARILGILRAQYTLTYGLARMPTTR